MRVVRAKRWVCSLRAVVLRILLLSDVLKVLWHFHLTFEIICLLLIVFLFIWAIFIIFRIVKLQRLYCKLTESPPIIKLAASALSLAFCVWLLGRTSYTVRSILSWLHFFLDLRHDSELLSELEPKAARVTTFFLRIHTSRPLKVCRKVKQGIGSSRIFKFLLDYNSKVLNYKLGVRQVHIFGVEEERNLDIWKRVLNKETALLVIFLEIWFWNHLLAINSFSDWLCL